MPCELSRSVVVVQRTRSADYCPTNREKLSPHSVATVRSGYETMWARAINREYWSGAVRSAEIARIGVYALEAYGIFKIGEIVGKSRLVGYNVN
ncbi:hypothetical protein D9758_010830 [Tetrapyrgos nigripes]|uniref:ATP synthase subunit g, mitochondrial n=1 Tax=Tetrapyrgos nigripes TaxID=182062 RepID=A0A8H5GHY1_9AGAR|nr:hypothetical protein D9758_010830 [Tetrapyrgos nigripes]